MELKVGSNRTEELYLILQDKKGLEFELIFEEFWFDEGFRFWVFVVLAAAVVIEEEDIDVVGESDGKCEKVLTIW